MVYNLQIHLISQMVQFSAAIASGESKQKMARIKTVYNDYFSQPGTSSFLSEMVASYLNLMSWQVVEEDSKKGVSGLIGASTIRTLFHCSRHHHWTDPSGGMPVLSFAKQYQVPDAQLEYVILTERAKNQSWCDLESIFEKKQLLKKSFQLHIPLEKVILRLQRLNAPQATLYYFLNQEPDYNKRLALARTVNCIKAIIDCYVGLKLKPDLVAYKDVLLGGSPEKFYADQCIAKLK